MKLLEAVPNLSDGSNPYLKAKILKRLLGIESLWVLGVEPHFDAKRTVITLVGTGKSLLEGLFALYQVAALEIDMRSYQSIHPHIGAVDLCPIIPLGKVTKQDAQELVQTLAKLVWEELKIPVFFYHNCATDNSRIKLSSLRKGNYVGLEKRIAEGFAPDLGDSVNVKSGATILGQREFLIAFNINLKGATLEDAKYIASVLRKQRKGSKMESVEFIGWYLEEFKMSQVSCNLRNYQEFGLEEVYSAVDVEARKLGIYVSGSELIGLAPLKALLPSHSLGLRRETKGEPKRSDLTIDPNLKVEITRKVKMLGLEELGPFDIWTKILELRLQALGGPYEI
ncbi:MAG: glutamate formimidoyltransferase [SAR324 cluster bacterium]|nr:glutamate formimidoyltransferase [SAR324 cluster bacterium]